MKKSVSGLNLSLDLFFLGIIFSLFWPAPAASGPPGKTFGPCPEYIWIDCAGQSRHKNGALTQTYYIRPSSDMGPEKLNVEDFRALYRFKIRSKPQKRPYGFDLFTPEDGYFTAPVLRGKDGLYFTITSRGNNIVDVSVVSLWGRKQLLAHVVHPIFGKAPCEPQIRQGTARLTEDRPRLVLNSASQATYMQTGRTYGFMYRPRSVGDHFATILEKQGQVAQLAISKNGGFAYTPPHDPTLDRSGPYDHKQIVVLVKETAPAREYVTARTLLLHRAYLAHKRLKLGLMLFGATVLIFSLLAGFKAKHRWI